LYDNSVLYTGDPSTGHIHTKTGTLNVKNCTITENTDASVSYNYDGDVYVESGIANITNSILYNNGGDDNVFRYGGTASISYSLYDDGVGGTVTTTTGNITNSTPSFSNTASDDFTLTTVSVAKNTGTNTNMPSVDLLEVARDIAYDMGCYEFKPNYYWVGGTGNWSQYATHWASTSGGSSFQTSAPTSADNVYFDANSGGGICTIDAQAYAKSVTMTGYTGTLAGTSALDIYGGLTVGSGMTWSHSGTTSFRSTSAGKTITSNGKTLACNLTFNGSEGTWIIQDALSTSANLTITLGRLDVSSSNYGLSVGGNWSNSGAFSGRTGTVTLNGSSAQTISGSSNTTFNNLTLNNATGLTVSKGITINGTLTFTAGNITAASSSEAVTFGTSGIASGAADTKCIVGYCKKNTNSTTKFTFPVGTSSLYRYASITPSSTSATTWTTKYFGVGYGDYTVTGSLLHHPSSKEYWTIDRSGSANSTIELSWGSNSSVDADYADIVVVHYDGADWESAGGNNISGTMSSGVVSSNSNWSSYSPFTLGSKTGIVPLPIELISFTAKPYQKDVKVSWQTASEIDNDYFIVERSENGNDFSEIARIDGAGNSSHTINYFTIDTDFKKTVLYYRLKLISFNGEVTYSDIASVDMSQTQNQGVIIMTVNSLGQEVDETAKGIVFDIYSDGTSVKRIQF
jgi:hypothetical protein